jgi:hypothetical protein
MLTEATRGRWSYALPCQLPLLRGQSMLERLADKPSLLIGALGSLPDRRHCATAVDYHPRPVDLCRFWAS